MSADNRTKLYNALKSEGYTDIGGSQEEFNGLIENPKNLRLVYDALKTSGYTDIGKDYAEFEGLINPHYNPIAAQNPQAFAPEGEEIKPEQIVNGNIPTLKDTNRFQVSELSSRIEGLTAKRNKEIEEENRRKEEATPWYARAMKNMARGGIGGAPTYAVTNDGRLNDNEYMTLQAAAKSMRNAQNIIAEADHNAKEGSFADWLERSFAGGAVRGLGKTLYDPHTWDMGVLDVAENSALLKALDAYEAGNSLTEAQQALLDAKAVELATNAYFGSEVGRGYKAGQVTAEAIPFMLEMAINPASTAGKGAVNALTRYALKRFGTKAAKKGLSTAAKVATRVVGDVAGASAMAATTGAGNVAANTLERMAGDARFATDAAGRSSFAGTTNRENPATALAKSFGATTIENYSEMLGEYFAPVFTPIGKGLAKGLDKMKLSAVNRFIDDVKMSDIGRFVSDFEKQTQWSGVAGEYSEEVVGGVINALTVGDQTLDTDENTGVFNLEKNIETLTSVALMGGFMSSVKTLGYRTPVYRAQKQIDYADNAGQKMFEDWGDIKNKLDNDRSSLPFILMGANPEQRKVILDYYAALCNYNGVLRGKAKQEAEGYNTVNNSYDVGYATTDAQGIASIKKTMEGARAAISFLSDEAVQRLDENPVPTLELMESEGATDEELQAVRDYVNASAAYKGMVQRMNEEADEQTRGEQERLTAISNEEGMVQPVVLDNDTRAYIQKGTLDDEHIVVVDDNGVQSMVAPSTLRGVDNPYNAQESIQAMRDEYVNARLAELDNPVEPTQQTTQPVAAQYNYNDEVAILDDNNQPVRATIASNADGDGRMQVETETPVNGKRVNYFTAEEIDGRLYEAPGELVTLNDGQNEFRAKVVNDLGNGTIEIQREGENKIDVVPASWLQAQQTEQSTPTKEPIPMEKVGKEERPAYHLVPIERTLEELHGDADLTQQDIDAFITANITELQGEMKKVAEKEPKMGANIAKFKQDKIQWAEKQKVLQAKLDYYNELKKRNAELESSELQEAYNAPGSVEGVTTPDEVVAGLLGSIKITPESFKRETGLSTTEQKGLVGIIANEDKGGVSVERAAEIIAENYSDELAASGYTGDVQGIRDMIISVLSDGNPRTYAKRGAEQRANEEAENRRREIEAWVAQFDMSVEEYFLYEQTMLPRVMRDYQGFDENEYYSILADEYNNSNYDTERESESVGRGRKVLQGEQPVPARGTEPVGAGNEGGAVPSDVQGGTANGANEQAQSVNPFDALPSEGDLGAANGVAQEEIGQPVGISEQLPASEVYSLSEQTDNEGNRFYQKNGSIDLWDLSPLFEQARRQNAPIRLTERNIDHILDEHKKELGDSEESVLAFLDNVFSNATVLRKARSGGIFVVVNNTKTDKAAIIRLYPSKYGDYYNVESAGYYRKNKWKDSENVIAELSEPTQSVTASDVSKPQVPEEGGRELLNAETATTSASEDRNIVSNSQENAQKSGENGTNSTENTPEPRYEEEILDNGDKRITNYNSRGEVATVAIERDGKIVSVDSYEDGALFEHTEYDENGKSTLVTRFDKEGNVVAQQAFESSSETPNSSTISQESEQVGDQENEISEDGKTDRGTRADKVTEEVVLKGYSPSHISAVADTSKQKSNDVFQFDDLVSFAEEIQAVSPIKTESSSANVAERRAINLEAVYRRGDKGEIESEEESSISFTEDFAKIQTIEDIIGDIIYFERKKEEYKNKPTAYRAWEFLENTSREILAKKRAELQQGDLFLEKENSAFKEATERTVEQLKKVAPVEIATEEQARAMGAFGFSTTKEEFKARAQAAKEQAGIVAYGLNGQELPITQVEKHSFTGNLKNARQEAKSWAENNFVGKEYDMPEGGGKYIITKRAIGKYVDKTAVEKSENPGVHLSALVKLPEIISNSVDAEIHPDYNRGEDGVRRRENGIGNEDMLVHRLYGAIEIDGKVYRVKTTMHEFLNSNDANSPHSYEVTQIELIEDSTVAPTNEAHNPLNRSTNSISATKLLNGVEKSYDKGKKLLDESKDAPERMVVYHGSGAKFDRFDHSFMGTGEGAQAFGWGTYVTEVEGIGKQYAEAGNPAFSSLRAKIGNIDEALHILDLDVERANRELEQNSNETAKERAKYIIENAKYGREALYKERASVEKEMSKLGRNLYTVEIPDDNGSNYLHWDKRITDAQKTMLSQTAENEGVVFDFYGDKVAAEEYFAKMGEGIEGFQLYKALERALGSDKAASEFLGRAGFVGIRYTADRASGVKRSESNYVIFNESDARITDRVEFFRTANGTVYGWAVNGKVYLTPDGINPNTPVHEYTHLWASVMEKNNPEEWAKIVEGMKASPVWNEVLADEGYRDIWNNDNRVASEVLSRLAGRENYRREMERAQREIDNATNPIEAAERITFRESVKQAVQRFWDNVKRLFQKITGKAGEGSWNDFVEMPLRDFWAGVKPEATGSPLDRMFIGEQGAANLDKAQEATTRLDNLAVAREMESAGKEAKVIKLATGWERGADGKWRYEVEDALIKETPMQKVARLKEEYKPIDKEFDRLNNATAVPLRRGASEAEKSRRKELNKQRAKVAKEWSKKRGEIWGAEQTARGLTVAELIGEDNVLLKMYPELTDMQVSFVNNTDFIDRGYNGFYDGSSIWINPNAEDANRVFTHEIQHAIQEIEGFAKGSNVERFADVRGAVLDSLNFMTNGDLLKGSAISDVQSLRDALDKNIPYTEVSVKEGYAENLQKVANKYGYENIDALVEDFANMPSAFEQYRRTAGEVESRNVQARMDMTAEERRNSLAAETEDVARKDQVFIYENLGESAMGTNVVKRRGNIASHFAGKNLTGEQKNLISAFEGTKNDVSLDVIDNNGQHHHIAMKQGNENKAGIAHSILHHFETISNNYTADEILLIPDIVKNGTQKKNGNKIAYEYSVNGVTYTVTTVIKNRNEEFTNFFTDRKPAVKRPLNTASQHGTSSQPVSANKGSTNSSNTQEGDVLNREGTPATEEFINATVVASNWGNTHKGAAPCIVIQSAETLRAQLEQAGFSAEDIADAERIMNNGATGGYNPNADKVVIFKNDLSKKELRLTLWHENAHRAIEKLYTQEEIERVFKAIVGEYEQEVREELAKIGYKVEDQAEEFLVQAFEHLLYDAKARAMLEGGKFKAGEGATDESKILAEFIKPIIKFINNGGERGYNPDGGIRESDRENQGGYVGQHQESLEVRNAGNESGDTRKGIKARRGTGVALTFDEAVAKGLMELAAKNSEDYQLRVDALKSFTKLIKEAADDLAAARVIRGVAARQKDYDKATVQKLMSLASLIMNNSLIDNFTRGEVKRLIGAIHRAVGKKELMSQGTEIVSLITDRQIKACDELLTKQLKTKASKINASGVEVQSGLDIKGQRIMGAFKDGKKLDIAKLNQLIAAAREKMGSADNFEAENAALDLQGYMLAQHYLLNIKASEDELASLKMELKSYKEQYDAGKISHEDYKASVALTEEAMLANKLERVGAYLDIMQNFGIKLRASVQAAAEFREREVERARAIQHNANSDMQGISADSVKPDRKMWEKVADFLRYNNPITRGLMLPMATFENLLKKFGEHSVVGRGYLYDRFVPQFERANDTEYRKVRQAMKELDSKLSEIFGKEMKWNDLAALEKSMPGMSVKFWSNGKMIERQLSQGHMLYIYMVNKMVDGRMKLNAMGITEDKVREIISKTNPKFIELADWIQDTFLQNKRREYNAVYERMFGAPMANIEDYFPLVINQRDLPKEIDVAAYNNADTLPSTITGSVIKRVRNNKPLDITNANAFAVVVDHINKMEHWAAFAEFNRDLNVLLSYNRFKNQVLNMKTVRFGSGEELWKTFRDVCAMAAGSYVPEKSMADEILTNLSKGVAYSKVSFGINTAIKQLLSTPAFATNVGLTEVASNIFQAKAAWDWANSTLPGFKERIEQGSAGDNRLNETDADWDWTKMEWVQKVKKAGMLPNIAVDAVVVAIGAKSVYDTKVKRYKADGYSDAIAHEKALADAAIAYNTTQQSGERAYLSKLQQDRTFLATLLSTFRNNSFAYGRIMFNAVSNLKNMIFKSGYREESIGFMTKKMVREGLSEGNARKAAERIYNRAYWKNIAELALFSYGLQLLWNLGANMWYLLLGDDDEEKKEIIEDAVTKSAFMVDGVAAGDMILDVVEMAKRGRFDSNVFASPFVADLSKIGSDLVGNNKARGVMNLANCVAASMVGVSPQRITDVVVAIIDVCDGDLDTANEVGYFLMRVAQVPESQQDKFYLDEVGMNAAEAKQADIEVLAKRYARYKRMKEIGVVNFALDDFAKSQAEEKYFKRFEKMFRERLHKDVAPEEYSIIKEYEESGEYKEIEAQLKHIKENESLSPIEYATRMDNILSSPEGKRFLAAKGYKKNANWAYKQRRFEYLGEDMKEFAKILRDTQYE